MFCISSQVGISLLSQKNAEKLSFGAETAAIKLEADFWL